MFYQEDLDDEVEASFMRILEKSVKASKKNRPTRIKHIDLSDIEGADEDSMDGPNKLEKGKKSEKKIYRLNKRTIGKLIKVQNRQKIIPQSWKNSHGEIATKML